MVGALSLRVIASSLGRSPSTISREVKPNGGSPRYRAISADDSAWTNALRPKACWLVQRHPDWHLRGGCDAGLVVEDLDVVENIGPGHVSGIVDAFADTLFLQTTEEGFRHGRSHQLPRRLMLGPRLLVAQKRYADNTVLAAGFTRFPKIAKHATRAVNPTTGRVRASNRLEQSVIVLVAVENGLVQPLIEPGWSNPQHFAHRGDRMPKDTFWHHSQCGISSLDSGCPTLGRQALP